MSTPVNDPHDLTGSLTCAATARSGRFDFACAPGAEPPARNTPTAIANMAPRLRDPAAARDERCISLLLIEHRTRQLRPTRRRTGSIAASPTSRPPPQFRNQRTPIT